MGIQSKGQFLYAKLELPTIGPRHIFRVGANEAMVECAWNADLAKLEQGPHRHWPSSSPCRIVEQPASRNVLICRILVLV